MNPSTAASHTDTSTAVSWKATLAAAGIGAVGGLIINSVIAWAGRSLFDVPGEFQPLTPGAYGTFTVLGALIGAIGWRLIVNRSRNANRLLGWLVPTVLVLSLIPDVMLLADKTVQPGTTTAGVIALMLMHFGIAAAAVPAYRRLMPPRS